MPTTERRRWNFTNGRAVFDPTKTVTAAGVLMLAGDGKLWTAVLRGDLAVAVYDSEGDSAALMKRYLKGS